MATKKATEKATEAVISNVSHGLLHKSKLPSCSLPSESCVNLDKSESFHSLSYYLNGGIDLVGDALDKSAEVEYDNEEELEHMDAEGAMSVPYGDPRMSKFRLVEQYGVYEAQRLSSKSAKTLSPTEVSAEPVTE